MDGFKGNPNTAKTKQAAPVEKNITPITSQVTVKKETEVKKFARQFISDDAKSVKGYIFMSVIVPGIQRLLSDVIKNTVDGIIYGIRGIRPDRGNARNISYSSYYDRNTIGINSGIPTIPTSMYAKSNVYSVNDVIFYDRGEAEETLLRLREEIERYGMVSVGDFYDLISQKHVYTDLKYGWRDLREAEVVRVRDGYAIRFPKIIPLE